MALKEKLIYYRNEADYTQQEIADLIGVERSTYACYESGKAVPPIAKLELLAIIYHVDLNAFHSANLLPLHSDALEEFRGGDERIMRLTKEERIMIAKIRLLYAMGKREKLLRILDDLYDEDEEQ